MSHVWQRRSGVFRRGLAVALVVTTVLLSVVGFVAAALNAAPASGLQAVAAVAFGVIGALIAVRRPENGIGWLLCVAGLAFATLESSTEYASRALVTAPGSLPGGDFAAWLGDAPALLLIGLLAGLLPQLFPTGHPISARWRAPLWAAVGYMVFGVFGNVFQTQTLDSVPGRPNPYAISSLKTVFAVFQAVAGVLFVVAVAGGVASLVVRWRRAEGDERQQLKWFIAVIALLPVPLALHDVFTADAAVAATDLTIGVVFSVIPVAMGIAIFRYRLYDLDLVINRALVYLTLSGMIAALYLGLVAVAQLALGGNGGLGLHVAAAIIAAAAFQPLRSRVQQGIDRLFYGDRARPYDAVGRLGRRLEDAASPDTVLPRVAEAVAEALRVPYVAIELADGETWSTPAESGASQDEVADFPMVYQGESIGRLLVSPRAGTSDFSAADRRLLGDLARQAGVAAHAVQVTVALHRSRAALITAREEERRRLRRDLHDGLGPALAGVTLGLHAAQTIVGRDPDRAVELLGQLERQVEQAVGDIRRLVYGLRPPALDEFGLARAVQQHATHLEGSPDGLIITVDVPTGGLGQLPAAVEVAAYRIATEAMTNVVRHASARRCTVRMGFNHGLELEVADDGTGFAAGQSAGVGLMGIRERAEELGGELHITSSGAGTRVRVCIPLPELS
jgi:signal transduction histidine kinase